MCLYYFLHTRLPVTHILHRARLLCCASPSKIKVLHLFAEGSGTLELWRSQTATEPQPVYTYLFI